jgi:TonB family protein
VGANVMQAQLISQPIPVYPRIALTAHISGTVVLHAIIGKDGTIQDLQYVSGPPLLMRAAMDAVRLWRYKPVLLNGEPVAVDTVVSVVFTLEGKQPPDSPGFDTPTGSSASGNALRPVPEELPPPTHPAAARAGQIPYPDTPEGMKAQMEAALKTGGSDDKQKFANALDSFAFENPKVWLTKTFGAEAGGKLVADYEASLRKFKEHITTVSGYWAKSPTSYLLVEDSLVPKPPGGDEGSQPPRPITPLSIENFQFNVKTGQVDPADWVFSFVYMDGAFRIVGGTFAFWDDDWSSLRDEELLGRMNNSKLMNSGIEGVESICPGDGLVRVFVSPKAEAARLKVRVEPIYPDDAKKAGIEGTVLFHAIIGADGTVKELELEDGEPALAKPAEDAVRQWKYEGTNYYENTEGRSRPAEVDTAIAVQFKLSH